MKEHPIADVVIIAKSVFCSKSPQEKPSQAAIAILGNRIVALEKNENDINSWIGSKTKIYRFGKDRLVMPGICDSHLHLDMTIASETGPQLRFVQSEAECVYLVQSYAENHPDVPWIIGFGWHHSNWPSQKIPDNKLLNNVISNRPVCLIDTDCHAAWVNDLALDIMGYNKPHIIYGNGGIIHLDADGIPTGYLEEGPALDTLFFALQELFSSADIRKSLMLELIDIFKKFGITSVFHAMGISDDWLITLAELEKEDNLDLRINICVYVNDTEKYLDAGKTLQKKYPDKNSKVTFWGYKIVADGVTGIHTAWLTEPYSDLPDTCGYPLKSPETIRKWILDIEKQGNSVHIHAVGNKAVEFALDVFEEADKLGYIKKQRNTITHCDVVSEKDFVRFGKNRIVASVQPAILAPQYSFKNNIHDSLLGERMKNSWAFQTLYQNAAMLSLSTDSPVTIVNPMNNIFIATQRTHIDGTPKGGINPEQKLSMAQSLYSYTYGGAYQLAKEDILGSLEVGKIADICVLDKNIFFICPDEIKEIRSLLTIVNGRVVYDYKK